MLTEKQVFCPYCGEAFTSLVEPGYDETSRYIEDCQVCCRPILFEVGFDHEGNVISFSVRGENE